MNTKNKKKKKLMNIPIRELKTENEERNSKDALTNRNLENELLITTS